MFAFKYFGDPLETAVKGLTQYLRYSAMALGSVKTSGDEQQQGGGVGWAIEKD